MQKSKTFVFRNTGNLTAKDAGEFIDRTISDFMADGKNVLHMDMSVPYYDVIVVILIYEDAAQTPSARPDWIAESATPRGLSQEAEEKILREIDEIKNHAGLSYDAIMGEGSWDALQKKLRAEAERTLRSGVRRGGSEPAYEIPEIPPAPKTAITPPIDPCEGCDLAPNFCANCAHRH